MCGIAGIWQLDNGVLSQEKLQLFTNSMSHRGPDASSYWIHRTGFLGLGHRRLSILDLSPAGIQPMSYSEGRYKLTYNGEIFNFLELRRELEKKSYKFISESDSEVILAAYDCWGHECLSKFNGMWAFAIWDEVKQSLFMARDRFGIKPLFYLHQSNHFFAFASETYAFKFLDGYSRMFNNQNLAFNLIEGFGLEAHGHTIYKDIYQVLPGHYMEFSTNTSQVIQKRWWSTLSSFVSVPSDYGQQVEYFKELFFDAVKIRMRSDVPVASALSGGLDSSSVYCAMHHIMNNTTDHERTPGNWQQAFVATFPGSAINERSYAEQVIEYTNGKVTYLEPDFSNLPQKIINSTLLFDSIYLTPIIAASDVYHAMSLQHIKVSLDGHGVDEMLFGYPDMIQHVRKARLKDSALLNDDLVETILDMYSPQVRSQIKVQLTTGQTISTIERIKDFGRKNIPISIQKTFSKYGIGGNEFGVNFNSPGRSLSDSPYNTTDLSEEQSVPFHCFHRDILPTILRNFDRVSMQSGIEIRMPFLDYRLVSFIFSLPFGSKVGEGYSKRIVRDAMKGFLPEPIRTRKLKVGFNAPMTEWFSGELKEFIQDEISTTSFLQSDIWNGKKVKLFAEKRMQNSSWSWNDCISFWPILNAHLLISNNKNTKK